MLNYGTGNMYFLLLAIIGFFSFYLFRNIYIFIQSIIEESFLIRDNQKYLKKKPLVECKIQLYLSTILPLWGCEKVRQCMVDISDIFHYICYFIELYLCNHHMVIHLFVRARLMKCLIYAFKAIGWQEQSLMHLSKFQID